MSQVAHLTAKGAATRSHVLAVAAGMFWRHSYHGVSLDDLAANAGVNKATIYRYFDDKADLAVAVIDRNGRNVLTKVFEAAFREQDTPTGRLDAIYSRLVAAHQEVYDEEGVMHGCPIAGMALEIGLEIPEIQAKASEIFGRVESYFWQIAEAALAHDPASSWDVDLMARTLAQILHGALMSTRVEGRPTPLREAARSSRVLVSGNALATV